ncbi:MAG: YybH family protein [Candidatus Binataceae bacterium]
MQRKFVVAAVLLALAIAAPRLAGAQDDTKAEKELRAIGARWADAFRRKDADALIKLYVPGKSLVVFDVIPPRQYVGSDAYRQDFKSFFDSFKGPIKLEVSDYFVSARGGMGYARSIQHVVGRDANGRRVDVTVRSTDCFQKIDGKWYIVHEHVSVPVDLNTAKADLQSKP